MEIHLFLSKKLLFSIRSQHRTKFSACIQGWVQSKVIQKFENEGRQMQSKDIRS